MQILKVVRHENGGKQRIHVRAQGEDCLVALIARCAHLLLIGRRERKERHLRTGHQCRDKQQHQAHAQHYAYLKRETLIYDSE